MIFKEVVGTYVLLTRSLFAFGILRKLLRRVFLANRLLLSCDFDGGVWGGYSRPR
jgi:hypothetical protein